MIKPKKKICVECKKEDYIWSKSKCKNCSLKTTKKLKVTKTKKPVEVINLYKILSGRPGVSIESGKKIPDVTPVNLAHIFPKETYKSVAANQDNIVILTWEEHTRFDELLSRLDFESLEVDFKNSWGIVCSKVKKILPLVVENGFLKTKFENYL